MEVEEPPVANDQHGGEGVPPNPEGPDRAIAVAPPQTTAPQEVAPAPNASPEDSPHTAPTRLSATWTAVVAAAVVLIALVIFIGQNTQQSSVNFLGAHGKAPTSVVLLIAALAGAMIVIIVGIARILQLRKTAKQGLRHSPDEA